MVFDASISLKLTWHYLWMQKIIYKITSFQKSTPGSFFTNSGLFLYYLDCLCYVSGIFIFYQFVEGNIEYRGYQYHII